MSLFIQSLYQNALFQLENLFVNGTIGGPIPSLRQWKNFNGRVKFGLKESDYLTPKSLDELKQIAVNARDRGYSLKPVGSGHSFNDITVKTSGGKVVSLREHYNKLISVDKENKTVTVQAGMVLRVLYRELEKHGLAVHNTGNYYEQTVGGAIATGTHGTTGKNRDDTFTSIIKRLEVVTSNGDVVVVDAQDSVTLGTLGIIHQITLRCVDMFWIEHKITTVNNINDFMNEEDVGDLLAKNDYMFFRWITMAESTEKGTLETFNIIRDKSQVTPFRNISIQFSILIKYWFLTPLGNYIPVWLARIIINNIAPLIPKRRVDAYYLALAVPGLIAAHFESEWAFPRAKLHDVMQFVTNDREELFGRSVVEVHIRFSPADTARLSPAYGRDTAWVNVNITDLNLNIDGYCNAMIKAGGRPHWSKVHYMHASQVKSLLGYDFSSVTKLSKDLDSTRVFSSSPYVERVWSLA